MSKTTTILVLIQINLLINNFNLIESKESLIGSDINGLIAAFGDFDSDKLTDVFLITENGKSLELAKGFPSEPLLRKWTSIKCTFNNTNDVIVGVIPTDFTGKAMMDVMVVTKDSKQSNKDKLDFKLWLFRGNIHNIECNNTTIPLAEHISSHPLILDYNGDMIADFIVQTDNCSRELWIRGSNGWPQPECLSELQPLEKQTMRYPNSNAFINLDDYDKDMSPDIFISGDKRMEYWHDKQGFTNNPVIIAYPDPNIYTSGQSAFVDINIDGRIDHILPVCFTEANNCKESLILGYDKEHKNWVQISDFRDEKNETTLTFATITTLNNEELPITLRPGDIDGDGYVDLITVMQTNDNKRKAVILKNVKASNSFKRQFVIDWTSDKVLSEELNVEIAAFIDLFEDGKLDILMNTRDETSNKHSLHAVANTQMIAACFLKVLVTSGLCYGSSCPRGNIPYGTNQFGPFICYELADTDGKMQTQCSGQLSQSAHFALQMPYSVFGLGETPNFVETVSASIPSGRMPIRKSKWTQIVPDAQVVLIPFPPNETDYWISKLFYTPSNIVFSTLITLASICCVLVLIIGILHRKELLEDLAEHEEYKRHWPESR
jgi:integrin alpha FG-GAP repeat containing protein 1